MIQPIRRPARVPLLALVVVALTALVSVSLARIAFTSATPAMTPIPTIVRTDIGSAEQRVVQAPTDKTGCSAGAYVSGDLAGETSPTEVYAAMCGKP